MDSVPDRAELVGLVGLGLGFVPFSLGAIAYAAGSQGVETVGLMVGGGLLGFVAAGFLVVHYHVVDITGG